MKEQQIKEMARDIFEPKVAIDGIDIAFAAVHGADSDAESHFMRIARHLYKKGYRKQTEGEWITPTTIGGRAFNVPHCSVCDGIPCGVDENTKFCPNCGAKMKGNDNE